MNKNRIALIIAVLLLISVSSCYSAGPWRGKVIDAETKEPIEGAVVVAVWSKVWAGLGAGSISSFLDAEETVTDINGEFEIPAKYFLSVPYFRRVEGPYFTIYKPGYGYFPKQQVSPTYTPLDLFEGKGSIVELPKLITREERIKNFPGLIVEDKGKIKTYLRILNDELIALGLEPYTE